MLVRIRKVFSILLLSLLALFLSVPGLKLLQYGGKDHSNTENRDLARLPALPKTVQDLSKWPTLFGDFVSDHFGFRSQLVQSYNLLHVKLGISPVNRVLVGKDGWLFLNESYLTDSNRGAIPLSAKRIEELMSSFENRQQYLESVNKKLIVFPVPDKNSLYPEFLPASVKIVGPSRFAQFRDAMSSAKFDSVDSQAALEVAKSRGEVIYFQTDSHWNCRGAWFAYLELMKNIRETGYQRGRLLDESEVDFIQPEQQPHATDIVRNLLNLEGHIKESNSYICRINNSEEIQATRPSDGYVFEHIEAPPAHEQRIYKHSKSTDQSRVLVYRDSYAISLLPFLIHSFDEVIYATTPAKMGFDPADIKRFDPDLVIFEFVERSLIYPPNNDLLQAELH